MSLRPPRLALLLAVLPASLHAQALPDSVQAAVDRLFARYGTDSPGCLVGVERAGQVVLAKGYGMANLEFGVPLTRQSISESGSVAKQFTAAAVVLLQLDGKLTLDDDIRRYLPEVPDFGTPITIRHLLSHTSGLRDQWALLALMGRGPGSMVHTNTQVLDLVRRQRALNFAPGTDYLYSNTGYVLAATIVSRVSGRSFAQFTTERLFRPLGMLHTEWRDDYRRVVPGRATAYARAGGAWVQDMPFTMVHGNGGLLSTLDDLLAWNRALTDGFPGHPALTRLLETVTPLAGGEPTSYALGLMVAPWNATTREVSHSGATAGYRTWLARLPEARTSVAVWCNAANADPVRMGREVAALVVPRDVAERPAPTPFDAATRAPLVGTWRDPRTEASLRIEAAGDYLRLAGAGGDSLLPDGGPGRLRSRGGVRLALEAAGTLLVTTGEGVAARMTRAEPVAAARLDDFTGRFAYPELGYAFEVRRDGDRLLGRVSPDLESPLVPYYADGFRLDVGPADAVLRFTRDARGRVTGGAAWAGRALQVRFERVP